MSVCATIQVTNHGVMPLPTSRKERTHLLSVGADLEVNMTTNGIKPWMPHHSCAQLSALKYCTLTTASKIASIWGPLSK